MRVGSLVSIVSLGIALAWQFPVAARAEWLEPRKLYGIDTGVADTFGSKLALDGDRLAVGAPQSIAFDTGKVYLFERNAGGPERWRQVAMLTPSDGRVGWLFGDDLALDGDTLVAAAPLADDSDGSVYIFERQEEGTWLEVKRLSKPPDPDTDTFANAVAVEGETVFVGSGLDDEADNNAGAVWVYERNAGGPGQWGLVDKLTTQWPTSQAYFGTAAAVEGGILVVGARKDRDRGVDAGAVHIFERDGSGAWIEVAKLVASDGDGYDYLGTSVAISGQTVVGGAYKADDNDGAVYVFERDERGAWIEVAKLTSEFSPDNANLGGSVAIWGDLIAVGAVLDRIGGIGSGAAHLFARDGEDEWIELAKLKPEELERGDEFGFAVAAGPATVVVGARLDTDRGFDAGTAYLYLERNLLLGFEGACPGEVTLSLTGATAQAPVALLSGVAGKTLVPAGPCAGTAIDLAHPRLLRLALTDEDGALSVTSPVGPPACGRLLQVLDLATCATSGVAAPP